jgi:hypothetical protein
MIPNTNLLLIFVILAVGGWGWYEHGRFLSERTAYSEFRETSAEQALKQEKEHALQVNDAMSTRDAAINRLRDNEIRSRSLRTNITPQGSERLCFNRTAFDAALQQFLGDVEVLLAEGDTALINLQTTLAAWPK